MKLPSRTPPQNELEGNKDNESNQEEDDSKNGMNLDSKVEDDLVLEVEPAEVESASGHHLTGVLCGDEVRLDEKDGHSTLDNRQLDGRRDEEVEESPHLCNGEISKLSLEAEDYKSLGAWEEQVASQERRLRRIRVVALVSGCFILAAVIFMLVEGVGSLVKTLDNTILGLEDAERLAIDAAGIVDAFLEKQRIAEGFLAAFQKNISGIFCPKLCVNLTDLECFASIPYSDELSNITNLTKVKIYEEFEELRGDMLELGDTFVSLQNTAKTFNWAFYLAAVFAGLLALLDVLMMVGIILAWKKKLNEISCQKCFTVLRDRVFILVFLFLVTLSFVFSMVFVIGSTASADMCVDSPDPKLQAFIDSNRDDFTTLFNELATFYLSGCSLENVPPTLRTFINYYLRIVQSLFSFISNLADENEEEFKEICGPDLNLFNLAAVFLREQICIVTNTIFDVQEFFACNNWHPLYSKLMYDAVCLNGVKGFQSITLTQIVIVFCAAILLTLRVAFYEVSEQDETPRQSCCSCLPCCSSVAYSDESRSERTDQNLHVSEEDTHGAIQPGIEGGEDIKSKPPIPNCFDADLATHNVSVS